MTTGFQEKIVDIEEKANDILERYHPQIIPIDPLEIANAEGIEVISVEFTEEEISGLIDIDGMEKTIFVNHFHHPVRKRFTIAHELGHYFLHLQGIRDGVYVDNSINESFFRKEVYGDTDKQKEREANQFAASLLMPKNWVEAKWKETYDIGEMAKLFNVSSSAMGYRLINLGIIQA
ncbi:ImmA/IrrE family metallo-endopeptidase [Halobacillus trueperi]|nr:ImmA/IrrE family metallo-endopeptidase [Halobacillus trueperi]